MTGILKLRSFAETSIQPSEGMVVFIRLDNEVAEWLAEQEDDFIFEFENKRFRLAIVNDIWRKANWGDLDISILVIASATGDIPVGPEAVRGLLPVPPVNQAVMYSTFNEGEASHAIINSVICPS